MSMYNMLFGKSPAAELLLGALGLTEGNFYRFRDCYLDEKGRIAVYTRGGGGNRGCSCYEPEAGTVDVAGEQHTPGCVVVTHATNRKHPAYLFDEDDDFDSTYATFYFRVPETMDRAAVEAIEPEMKRDEAWTAFLDALNRSVPQ